MATNTLTPSLDTLPIELLYRILDILDNDTILFSFGYVCKRFQTIIHTYNQYQLNFQSISKSYFHSICRLIVPENIISLTLSNDNKTPDQIKCFFSLFQIEDFIRLRSLTLIDVDENDFNTIFQSCNTLSSLSFTFRNRSLENPETLPLLSSIISQTNLRNLDFTLSSNHLDTLPWPNQSLLHSLTISNHLNFNQFSTILSHSLHLKKLLLQDCIIDDSTEISSLISNQIFYQQLISLTFDDCELDMNQCELILSLTPSLKYLHLVGGTNLPDGSRWEQFIKNKLVKLNQFEFAFCGHTGLICEDLVDIQSLINSFRTPFWLENKHWFVVCYYFKDSGNYSLYSLPICRSNVRFYPQKDKISCSTYPNLFNDVTITDNVHEMQLNLTRLMIDDDDDDEDKKSTSSTYPLFRKLNKLLLCIDDDWPIGSVEFLSTFIDLSCIVDLSISIDFDTISDSNKLTNISNLLKQTVKLHSLTIDSSSVSVENICLLVPDHLKHLQISLKHINDMKIIIEQLKHLSSVTCEVFNDLKSLSSEFVMWLMEKRNKSRYRIANMIVSIWLDKSNMVK